MAESPRIKLNVLYLPFRFPSKKVNYFWCKPIKNTMQWPYTLCRFIGRDRGEEKVMDESLHHQWLPAKTIKWSISPWVRINISTLLLDTVLLFSMGFSTITEVERCNMIAAKECLCPFSPSQAYKNIVCAPPPEYVNNSEVMQEVVLAAPVSGCEKLSSRWRGIFNSLIPIFTRKYTWHFSIPVKESLKSKSLPKFVLFPLKDGENNSRKQRTLQGNQHTLTFPQR